MTDLAHRIETHSDPEATRALADEVLQFFGWCVFSQPECWLNPKTNEYFEADTEGPHAEARARTAAAIRAREARDAE